MVYKNINIGIVNYGSGNISSLTSALSSHGYSSLYSDSIKNLNKCDLIILPGVGSFSGAINYLKEKKLDQFLIEYSNKKPIIGICLGMQLLSTSSNENGFNKGLDLIPGKVIRLKKKLYHTGWNTIEFNKNSQFREFNNKEFYFNHAYAYSNKCKYILSHTKINYKIVSIVEKKNIFGIQFHPEKSQHNGKLFISKLIKYLLNA